MTEVLINGRATSAYTSFENLSLSNLKRIELIKFKRSIRKLAGIFHKNSLRRPILYFENIVSPKHGKATATGPGKVTKDLEHVAEILTLRGVWLSDGNCVLPESRRQSALSHINYLKSQGLVSKNAEDNIWWVPSTTDLPLAYQTIQTLSAAKKMVPKVVPYLHASLLHKIAKKAGVELHGITKKTAKNVVDRFYDKLQYRDWIEKVHGKNAVLQPRFTYREGSINKKGIKQIKKAIKFSSQYKHDFANEEPQPVLFVQTGLSGGGFGNNIIYKTKEGKYFIKEKDGNQVNFANVEKIAGYIETNGSGVDITPFIPKNSMLGSYTLGMLVEKSRITLIGPLTQIMDPKTMDYEGFQVDINSLKTPKINREIRRAIEYGKFLQKLGFRGWTDEDLFIYREPGRNGKVKVARSESNIRRDGMTQLLGPIFTFKDLREKFAKGQLSLWQSDHFVLSPKITKKADNSEKLKELLEKENIPLFSKTNREGVIFITAPVKKEEENKKPTSYLTIAIVANSDKRRDEIIDLLRNKLQN